MPRGRGSRDRKLGGGRPAQSHTRVRKGMQVLKDEKEAAAGASSAASSSHTLMGATPREEPGSGTPSCPQNPQGIFSPPTAMASTPRSQCNEGSSREEEEGPRSSQGKDTPQIMQDEFLHDKFDKLMPFLLRKYQKKEQISMEELLHVVDHDYREHFPLTFRELCECTCLSFDIEMRGVDPPGHTYELLPILGLTYNGILDNEVQAVPKVDLLIFILSVISVKGNRLSEEDLRDLLSDRKVLGERERVVIGDPWKFVTEDLVREEYLVYQQVPNSDPARYEFLWGPRAHAETSQVKLLKYMFNLDRTDPRSYPHLYEQALREEKVMFRAPEEQGA